MALSLKMIPVVEYSRAHTQTAIAVLVDIMLDGKAKGSERVAAAREILSRGWGTPPQSLQVTGDVPKEFNLGNMTQEELRTFHSLLGKVMPADEVVEPQDMPDEKTLKVVKSIVPVTEPVTDAPKETT